MENLDAKDCLRTFTGKYVNLVDPKPEMIDIIDIAHGLAYNSRWGGQLPSFLSVAQHSMLCADLAPPELKFEALMHDSTEALLKDVPKPLKNLIPEYSVIEARLHKVIANKYGLSEVISKKVHNIDRFVLEKEWNDLFVMNPKDDGLAPLSYMTSALAKVKFLEMFYELMPERCETVEILSSGIVK